MFNFSKTRKPSIGVSKILPFCSLLLCTLLLLPGCSAPSGSSTANFQLEMELEKDYDDTDPFTNESLFTVTESVDSLNLAVIFTMKGGSGILEVADNISGTVLWSDQWDENIENSTFTIPLESLEKGGEYVIRLTGTKIEYAKVLVTCDSNMIQKQDRPEGLDSAPPVKPEESEQSVGTEAPGAAEQLHEPPAPSGQKEDTAQAGIHMEQEQYPLDAESVRIIISNKGSQNLGYDAYYSLELLQGEHWREVTANSELTIGDWAGILAPGKETSQTIELTPYTGKLQAGHYRIVKMLDGLVFYARFELV